MDAGRFFAILLVTSPMLLASSVFLPYLINILFKTDDVLQ